VIDTDGPSKAMRVGRLSSSFSGVSGVSVKEARSFVNSQYIVK
jgi:hypothetical protein